MPDRTNDALASFAAALQGALTEAVAKHEVTKKRVAEQRKQDYAAVGVTPEELYPCGPVEWTDADQEQLQRDFPPPFPSVEVLTVRRGAGFVTAVRALPEAAPAAPVKVSVRSRRARESHGTRRRAPSRASPGDDSEPPPRPLRLARTREGRLRPIGEEWRRKLADEISAKLLELEQQHKDAGERRCPKCERWESPDEFQGRWCRSCKANDKRQHRRAKAAA